MIFSNISHLPVFVVVIMSHSSQERSPELVPPEVFNLLKKMSDTMESLTRHIAALEISQRERTTVPLRSETEHGGTSMTQPPLIDPPREPLLDQRATYEAARFRAQ